MRSSKIGSSSMLRISVIVQMFRTANPKDCKNATFDAFNFFFLVQPDDWILANADVVVAGLVKIVLYLTSLFNTSISYAAYVCYHCRRRTCNLMVISSPRKSSKRPFWSTTRNVKSVMLRTMIGR